MWGHGDMKYFNIEPKDLNSGDFVLATPAQIGTWLRLLSYCVEQNDEDALRGAASWSEARWNKIGSVSFADVRAAFPLIYFEGDDARVLNFPSDQLSSYEKSVEGGRKGGKSKHKKATPSTPASSPPSTPASSQQDKTRQDITREDENSPATAFLILTSRPEVLRITEEQWAHARQCNAGHPKFQAMDWIGFAEKIVAAAVMKSDLKNPAEWVQYRLRDWLAEKNEVAADGGEEWKKRLEESKRMRGQQ